MKISRIILSTFLIFCTSFSFSQIIFYGVAPFGGAYNDGVLFKCDTAGNMTTLINFNGTNGANPNGTLIQASDGNLYGVTEGGWNI